MAIYTADTEDATVYFRTGRGAHKHRSSFCANYRRSIHTGDVFPIPAAELADWAPCVACCDEAEVSAYAAAQTAAAAVMCRNSGVTNPRRIISTCRDCGKEGKRSGITGTLRAHKPAK